jgi:uracil-DNA glycosylase family 4
MAIGQPVPGIGPRDAKIIIIGEAPGATEEQLGLPFAGGSGQLLNAILAQAGINRHECYITNVVKTRPPNNNFGIYYEDPKKTTPSRSLLNAYDLLRDELNHFRPNVVIPLGNEALRAATSRRGIEKWRGSIIQGYFGKTVPSLHPAFILRDYASLPIFEHDIRRAFEESHFPEIKPLGHVFELNPSYSRVIEYLSSLVANPRPIAFDIETTENHVRCLGIADSSTHAVCIPFMSSKRTPYSGTIFVGCGSPEVNSHWTEEEEYEILKLLDQIFSSNSIEKIAQNFPFDSAILGREFGFRVCNFVHDTMVASHTQYAELPKGLDFLASIHTRVPYYSDYDASVDEELWRYNCYDACVTYEIRGIQRKELEAVRIGHGYNSLFFEENHIEPAMKAMTRVGTRGVLIDLKVRDDLKSRFLSEMATLQARFGVISGTPDINLSSPKQLGELFYGKLHLPVQYSPKTGNQTVDKNAITELRKKAPQHEELFSIFADWSERETLVSTFLGVPLSSDNRFFTSFGVAATVTGRCNSSRTIWGLGSNLQNIPNRTDLGQLLRRMFLSDSGWTLVKCDLSQAEFRLVVWFAGIRRLISEYTANPNYDCHKWVASLIYKKRIEDVTKTERSIAKNGVYGGNYAMQPKKAAVTYKLSLADATWVLSEYRKAIPEIPQWWSRIEASLNSSRTLINPLGRTRIFLGRLDNNTYRDAYSHACQSTVADVIHRAATLSEILFDPTEAHVLMQIHDELVWQVRDDKLDKYLPMICNLMEYPLTIPLGGTYTGEKDQPTIPEPLIIPAELKLGKNWLDTTEWKPIGGTL